MSDNGVHEVLVVGAGPVGIMLAIELGRRNVDTLVVERRETRLRHPKASGIHTRTMEIFRQLGIAEGVRETGGLPLKTWNGFGYMTRINAPDIGSFELDSDPEQVAQTIAVSPEQEAWCAQDRLETYLREQLAKFPSVTVQYGLRVTSLDQDAEGASVHAVDGEGGEHTYRGRYVVGADGAQSVVRKALGVEAPVSETFGHQLNVCFEADLLPYMRDRRYMIWWVINREVNGALLTYDGRRRWSYSWAYDPEKESPEDFPPERCAAVVRKAIGADGLDISVENLFTWSIDAAIADEFRVGRTLLVGDAAHRFPPVGGFGMNSGIHDAHNLAWKLHLVVNGLADDKLLDTYAEERRAIAVANTEQVLRNTEATKKTAWVMADEELLAKIETPEGAGYRQQIADGIPEQAEQYWSLGQKLGFSYDSAAVVPDGTAPEPSTVSRYRPSGRPGARAPHLWLTGAAGERVSTIDLLHTRFTLLSTPAGRDWVDAAQRVAARRGLEIATYTIGDGGDYDADWAELYGVGPAGAVLVRPDGHVGFRAHDLVDDPGATIEDVLNGLLKAS
jgi:2-polyprenyl-6-methoxyphenol hydroxylase-like FAD-dependent oxidoreductase